jgi:hypothetical protein
MTLFGKIALSFRYGSEYLIASGVVSLIAAINGNLHPEVLFGWKVTKVLSSLIIMYLFVTFDRKGRIYFYLNLGISRLEYYLIPVALDLVIFWGLLLLFAPLSKLLLSMM